jgi:hypothetical protein
MKYFSFWMAVQIAIRVRKDAFKDKYDRYIRTVSLPPESGSHNEMHNLMYGRRYGKDKTGAVYAGI